MTLPEALEPLAWLLGTWHGEGVGGHPDLDDFRFEQELVVEHLGGASLAHRSRSWLLDAAGARVRPAAAEAGFWRPAGDGRVELLLAHANGIVELWYGAVTGARVEVATASVQWTESSLGGRPGRRLYGAVPVEGSLAVTPGLHDLGWAYDMGVAPPGGAGADGSAPLAPHLSARLSRRGAGPDPGPDAA